MIPLIMQGDLTGRWYIVTRYTKKDGCIVAQTKYDCTDRINEITAKHSPLTLEMVERVLDEANAVMMTGEYQAALQFAAAPFDNYRKGYTDALAEVRAALKHVCYEMEARGAWLRSRSPGWVTGTGSSG